MHAKSVIVVLTRISVLLVTALGATTEPANGQAGSYTFQTLDVSGASSTSASGINNSGQVVGTYCVGSSCHGFVLTQGQFAFVDAPNGNSSGTFLSGISNSGVVVGSYISVLDDKTHGFSGAQFADIVFPSTNGARLNTFAQGINTAGQVVGFYQSDRYPFPLHGFVLTGGSFAAINEPAATINTLANGINDAGQIVGGYGDSSGSHGFLFSGGTFTAIDFPGGAFSNAAGINNAGVIVGGWSDSGGHAHGFVLARGTFTSLDFPRAISTTANGINDAGDIVGSYTDANGLGHGFITDPISLVDPVPDLLNGSSVITPNTQSSAQLLATKGTVVQGVAADGVAEIVVRIMASNVGDQFTLTLVNDQNSQIIPDEDGALGNPGDTSFSQSQINVTAIATGNGANGPNPPFAFAVYRAPLDFARPITSTTYKTGACGGVSKSDDQLACRSVSIKVQDPSGNAITVPVIIVRPPVIMIHGLWDNWSTWNNFGPLVAGPGTADPRFSVGRVSYDAAIGSTIVASDPLYSTKRLDRVQANSIGFQYNARSVLAQIEQWIGLENFRGGKNPANIPVAAVQADIVAHSMGGDITRTLALQPTFLNIFTFGQGNIHKVITIDTPHLGSPVAIQLLSSGENGGCLQDLLAGRGRFTLSSVVFSDGSSFSGAVADLQGDDITRALSNALAALNSSSSHPLPTAFIAGVYTNFAILDDTLNEATLVRNWPFGCPNDPLAQELTSTGWPAIFHNNPNDAIVSENSQLNGLIPSPGSQFFGYVHSPGTENLGFSAPSVIDAGPVPNQVIFLLNTPLTNSVYYNLLNP